MKIVDLSKMPRAPKTPNGNYSVSNKLVGVYKQHWVNYQTALKSSATFTKIKI